MLTLDSKEFLFALSALSDIVPSSSYMAMLQDVFICCIQDKVMCTGRDLDRGFTIYLNGENSGDDFEFTLPLASLYGVVGQLAKRTDILELSLDKGKRNLKLSSDVTGAISLRLHPAMTDLLYQIPPSTKTAMAKIYPGAITCSLPVFNLCGGDKVILNMVNLKSTGKSLRVEGTNGLIGGYVETGLIQGDKFNTTFPADISKLFNKLVAINPDDYWVMTVTDTHTTFAERNGQWVLSIKNSETDYINLSRIYKISPITKLTLHRESLIDMLQMVNHIGKTNNKITLIYKDGQMWLMADSDTGDAQVKIDTTDVNGQSIRLSVHLTQLQKLVQQLPKIQDTITLEIASPAEPILIQNKFGTYFIIPTL